MTTKKRSCALSGTDNTSTPLTTHIARVCSSASHLPTWHLDTRPLPVPYAGNPRSASYGHDESDYELRIVHSHEREQYEPYTSLSSAPSTRPYLADDNSHAPYYSERTTVPTSKTAAASAASLTTSYLVKTPGSGAKKSDVRSTMLSWASELVATTVSVGALLAIVAILGREDGKPISEWSLAVTLNTVIATLGTLARTTLAFALSACVGQQKWNWLCVRSDHLIAWTRFDEASRGPWGATRLFVWLRVG